METGLVVPGTDSSLWTVAIIFFIPLVVIWSSVSFLVILLFPLPLTGVIWLAYAYCIKRFYAPKLKEAEAEVSFVQRKIQAEKIRDPNLTCLKIELDIMKKLEQQAYYAGFYVIYITVFLFFFAPWRRGSELDWRSETDPVRHDRLFF
jgi:hypothetical protein